MDNALGLVMTGGGARGAYQAGVLKRIGELKSVQAHGNPFPIIGGSSAGAVNGCALAVGCDEFSIATKVLAKLWAELRPSDIFRCDALPKPAIPLPGSWISRLGRCWAAVTQGRSWMRPLCGNSSMPISIATKSSRTFDVDTSMRWPS